MKQRWYFLTSELKNPQDCDPADEFLAVLNEVECGVLVYRDGTATDRYGDGTVGVTAEHAILAEQEDTLYDLDSDEAGVWRDVEVDEYGYFVRFAE